MPILKLTLADDGEPIRVNFDNVAYYFRDDDQGYTTIIFAPKGDSGLSINVAEDLSFIDSSLGI